MAHTHPITFNTKQSDSLVIIFNERVVLYNTIFFHTVLINWLTMKLFSFRLSAWNGLLGYINPGALPGALLSQPFRLTLLINLSRSYEKYLIKLTPLIYYKQFQEIKKLVMSLTGFLFATFSCFPDRTPALQKQNV